MKTQEGGKSGRVSRTGAVARRKAPTAKRRVVRPRVQGAVVLPEPVKHVVRGDGIVRLSEKLVLFILSYLVLLLMFWMAYAAYAMAVWQSIVPRMHAYRMSFAPAVIGEELPPLVPAETGTDKQANAHDGVLVVPSTVRDGQVYVSTGMPITVVAAVATSTNQASLSLFDVSLGSAVPVQKGVTRTDGMDGTVLFTIASSTLKSGQKIGVFGETVEGWPWQSETQFTVE